MTGDSLVPMPRHETLTTSAALAFDREHLWHPYTSMTQPTDVQLVTDTDGVRIRLADGRELVDAMASWWCAIHGYRHPRLDDAVRRQADTMSHVMFGGLTHRPAVDLGRRLVELTPDPLQHVFFADSGSVSVEVALKMAVQYQRGRGRRERTRMLALRGGYHGDTTGAMSVTDPVNGMHAMFAEALPQHLFADRPPSPGGDVDAWAAHVRGIVEQHRDELAAVICEPVLQGAGGMYVYDPGCLTTLRAICDEHGLLLVLDEIATGFGRTGTLFAAEHAGVVPDVMCVGKALTGGYLTLAATLCTTAVAQGIAASDAGVLMHGPTFMANPLACAVAIANLDLLTERDWQADVRRIEAGLRAGLKPATDLDGVRDVRVIGAVGVIELNHPVDVVTASRAAAERGVWIRPFRDLVYTMPPYVVGDHLVARARLAVERQATRFVLAERHHADLVEHAARACLGFGRTCGEAAPEHTGHVGGRVQHVGEAFGLLAFPTQPNQQHLASWCARGRAELMRHVREEIDDLDRPVVPLGYLGRSLDHHRLVGEIGEPCAVDRVVVRSDHLALCRRHVVVQVTHAVLRSAGEIPQHRARLRHRLPHAGTPEGVDGGVAPVVDDPCE